MHVLLAGGTGFLGHHLQSALAHAGHRLTILTRRQVEPVTHPAAPTSRDTSTITTTFITWQPNGSLGPWAPACTDIDAIINLAGESIGTRRWTARRKDVLRSSRLLATRSLAAFIHHATPPPAVFLSSSATGYYGLRGNEPLDEQASGGTDFLATLAADWEHEALRAASPLTRVVLIRTGLVLDAHGGALPRMLPPFTLGLGGRFGSGRQYMSWIHRADWVSMVTWLTVSPDAQGPYNATAPHPVTNTDFAHALGRTLKRPSLLRVPALALRLALGEMAGALLLGGQRVLPARALEAGFKFRFETIGTALEDLLE